MDAKSQAFLTAYLNGVSPSGYEAKNQQRWLDYISPYIDGHISDVHGSVAGIINPDQPYKVLIEAHADELSWVVRYVDDEGYIYVDPNGICDPRIAPAMRVTVHAEEGEVRGFFGWPSILANDEEQPDEKNLFIDIGKDSREEVEALGIFTGTMVTYNDGLMDLGNSWAGRGLDNRIGGFIIAEVARRIKEENVSLPYSLYIVNTVQEELGQHGARMMAAEIKPDVALVTDVCHDSCHPMVDAHDMGIRKTGEGPVLAHGPTVHNKVYKMLVEGAKAEEIPIQRISCTPYTGTDVDAFAYAGTGIASGLIGVPMKYMHTTVEMVSKQDVEWAIQLFLNFLKQVEAGQDFRYIQ